MRRLRISAGWQLRLPWEQDERVGQWDDLPEESKAAALLLLARLIAKSAIVEDDGRD